MLGNDFCGAIACNSLRKHGDIFAAKSSHVQFSPCLKSSDHLCIGVVDEIALSLECVTTVGIDDHSSARLNGQPGSVTLLKFIVCISRRTLIDESSRGVYFDRQLFRRDHDERQRVPCPNLP